VSTGLSEHRSELTRYLYYRKTGWRKGCEMEIGFYLKQAECLFKEIEWFYIYV